MKQAKSSGWRRQKPTVCASPWLGSLGLGWGGHFELAGCLDQYSQGLVDGLRVAEHRSHIGIKQHNVRTLPVLLVVFAANAPAEVVLRPHLVCLDSIILRTHIVSFRRGLRPARCKS